MEETIDPTHIGDRCRTIRQLRQLSKSDLCRLANVDTSVVELLESNQGIPNLRNFIKICRALEVSADELLGRFQESLPSTKLASRMVHCWGQLSSKEQEMLMQMCEVLASQRSEKRSPLQPAFSYAAATPAGYDSPHRQKVKS